MVGAHVGKASSKHTGSAGPAMFPAVSHWRSSGNRGVWPDEGADAGRKSEASCTWSRQSSLKGLGEKQGHVCTLPR